MPAHLIHDADAIGISLYDYFRSQHIFPQRTRSRVSARMPDAEFQSHIQMDSKVPVLVIKQVALDQQQRPIEYSISYCRSDLYVLCAGSASRVGAQSPPRWPTTQRRPRSPAAPRLQAPSRMPARPACLPRGCLPRQWYRRPLWQMLARSRMIAG